MPTHLDDLRVSFHLTLEALRAAHEYIVRYREVAMNEEDARLRFLGARYDRKGPPVLNLMKRVS